MSIEQLIIRCVILYGIATTSNGTLQLFVLVKSQARLGDIIYPPQQTAGRMDIMLWLKVKQANIMQGKNVSTVLLFYNYRIAEDFCLTLKILVLHRHLLKKLAKPQKFLFKANFRLYGTSEFYNYQTTVLLDTW